MTLRALLAWLVAVLALLAAPAQAVTYPPRPDGPVLDAANIIADGEQAALDAKLRAYTKRTGRALVVATVPSLEGETIELYAVRLFEQWGIGGKDTDQGLLLLVAPAERKVRIEVGYGLHQYVTDALSGRIIRNIISPRFREGDFAGGINGGVDALIEQLDRDPADAKAVAEAAAAAQAQARSRQSGGGAGIASVLFWMVPLLLFMFIFGRRGGRGRRRRFSGGGLGPIILWEAMNHMGRGGGGGFGGGMSGGGGASGSW